MKQIILSVYILLFSSLIFAQGNGANEQVFQRGRISTFDSTLIEAQYIVLQKDSVEYYVNDDQTRYIIGLNDVTEIQAYRGNSSNSGMWIGMIAGLVIGVGVSVATIEEETTNTGWFQMTETKISLWPIYVFTGVGTLIGYAIGSASEDWETVYSKSTAFFNKINLSPNRILGGYNLSFHITL